MEPFDPRDLLVSSRERRLAGMEPPHRDGSLEAVRRGYYRPAGELTSSQLYRLRIEATVQAREQQLVFSHVSAAELWGCPLLRADTGFVHATRPGKARRTTAAVKIHRSAIPEGQVVETETGLLTTSPEWTAILVAATLPLPNVLLPLDHLVRLLNTDPTGDPRAEGVIDQLIGLIPPRMKGGVRAEQHLRLADPHSGSAGESMSRGQMEILRVPRPELQVAFPRIDEPGNDVVDFDWPSLETFGEFDGEGKYFDEELTGGRSASQVLWEEKAREDRIRRHRPRASRWGWADAMSRTRLAQILTRAGIVPGSRRD